MAALVGICGPSGIGKTTSMKDLKPEETFVVSVLGKPLPFAGSKKNYTKLRKEEGKYVGNFYVSNKVDSIINILKVIDKLRPEIKYVVIDDSNYLMSCETMDRSEEKGYEKFVQIARHYYDMLMCAAGLRDNLKVFVLSHIENVGDSINPQWKLKTAGKMLDNTVYIDGLFTYMLYTEMIEGDDGAVQRVFRTNTVKGEDTCKTPLGCFETLHIPNSLQLVSNAINKYEEGE